MSTLKKHSEKDLLDELQRRVEAIGDKKLPIAQRLGAMRINELREILNPDSKGYQHPK